MSTKSMSSLLITAAALTFCVHQAEAGLPMPPMPPGLPGSTHVNVNITGYIPAPPGVTVQVDAGRPYYVERGHRVYMEKEHHGKHGKRHKKHHEDRGNHYGEEKGNGHGHGRGH